MIVREFGVEGRGHQIAIADGDGLGSISRPLFQMTEQDLDIRTSRTDAGRADEDGMEGIGAAIEALGGEVLVKPTDRLSDGTSALVADPEGALLMIEIWRAAKRGS